MKVCFVHLSKDKSTKLAVSVSVDDENVMFHKRVPLLSYNAASFSKYPFVTYNSDISKAVMKLKTIVKNLLYQIN